MHLKCGIVSLQDRTKEGGNLDNIDNIPEELRALPQWVVHRKKVPYNPHTGDYAKAGQPDTWTDFATAVHATGYAGLYVNTYRFGRRNRLYIPCDMPQ